MNFTRTIVCCSAILLSISTKVVSAQEIHSEHCLHGCPSGSPNTNDLVIRNIYILSSNDHTKFADWVAYKVTKNTIGTTKKRNWKSDPLLDESETLEPNDYKRANAVLKTDRGHQVPLASFTGTQHWRETNYLSNITPQKSNLNQGAWAKLESAVRDLARVNDVTAVYVMTGTLFERDMPKLPEADEDHIVPSAYWKIVAVDDGAVIKAISFYFDQSTPRSSDYCEHLISVDEIEKKSKLDFFHGLDDSVEDDLESGAAMLTGEIGCESTSNDE